MWTRSVDGKTEDGHAARGPEFDKVVQEVANYKQFLARVDQIVEVSDAICEARPALPPTEGGPLEGAGGEKGGSSRHSRRSSLRS